MVHVDSLTGASYAIILTEQRIIIVDATTQVLVNMIEVKNIEAIEKRKKYTQQFNMAQ